jgi:hypothetical protein
VLNTQVENSLLKKLLQKSLNLLIFYFKENLFIDFLKITTLFYEKNSSSCFFLANVLKFAKENIIDSFLFKIYFSNIFTIF